MMDGKTIWKFELPIDGGAVSMPEPGEVLAIEASPVDPGMLWVWAIVEPFDGWEGEMHPKKRTKHYRVYGTGHELPSDLYGSAHVATCLAGGGALVWHVFEVAA